MSFSQIVVSQRGSVQLITIDSPPINAVSLEVLTEVETVLDTAGRDTGIGAIVITGNDETFSGGADAAGPKEPVVGVESDTILAHRMLNKMGSYAKPIIAAVNGYAGNGGNEFALACDVRIAGENAEFEQPELQAGVFPGYGGVQRLTRLIGYGRAMEMMLSGRRVGAQEALAVGLVTKVVPVADTVDVAVATGQHYADILDPHGLGVFMERMWSSQSEPFAVGLRNDQIAFDELKKTPEAKAAIARMMKRLGLT